MADKSIGMHIDDFFNHVGFKTGASLFSELGIVQVPTKTTVPSAPTLTAFAAPGESSGVLEATITLPTTNTDGSRLVRAEIEEIALHYKDTSGVTTGDPFVVFSARETLPWNPGDLDTHYATVRVRDSHGNWSALSNERSAAAVAPPQESAGLWAHRLDSASLFTNIDPGAGDVTWANVVLYHKDDKYTITGGTTDKKYIWWDKSLSTTTFQVTDTAPTLEQNDVIIGYNDNGTWRLMVYSPMVMADYLRVGIQHSRNWGAAAGSEFDLDAGTIKLGGSSDPHFSVDASGNLVSKSGTVAGFTISAAEGLYAGANATRVQMKPGVGFWAGATAFDDAPFRVSQAGVLVATSATITGTITATAGTIAGFTVSAAEGLYAGSGVTRVQMKPGVGIWSGATAIGDAPFSVNQAGAVTAKSGTVAGFTIDATNGLYAGSGNTRVQMKAGQGFWAGATAYGDALFYVSVAGAMTSKSGIIAGFSIDATEGLYTGSGATRIQMKVGAGLWLGATAYDDAPFKVSPAGAVVASNISCTNLSVGAGSTWGGNVLGAAYIPTLTGDKISLTSYLAINNSTYGTDGIQFQYNAGNPRAYIGNGASAFFKFDGTKITWKAANSELDANGKLIATSVDLTGEIKATAGYFGSASTRVAIEAAGLNVGSTGSIRGGATAYNTGTGFWMGHSGGYKLFIGYSAGDKMLWTGSALEITGKITMGAGSTLDASYITAGTLSADRISAGTLNCSLMTVSNLSASSINTGTLNCSLMTVSNLSATVITAGGLISTGWPTNGFGIDLDSGYIGCKRGGDHVFYFTASDGNLAIGDTESAHYVFWNNAAGTLTVRGTLTAEDIVAGTLTGHVVQTAAAGGARLVIAPTIGGDSHALYIQNASDASVLKMLDSSGGFLGLYNTATTTVITISGGDSEIKFNGAAGAITAAANYNLDLSVSGTGQIAIATAFHYPGCEVTLGGKIGLHATTVTGKTGQDEYYPVRTSSGDRWVRLFA